MTEKQRQELCERFSQIFAVANPDPNVPFEKFIYDALLKAFIAGAEYAWNNPNWISVEDELPKEKGKYMFRLSNGEMYYETYYPKLKLLDNVTHWMPIVPPRKEDKNE